MYIAICDDEPIFINKISKLIDHPDAQLLAFDSGSKLLACEEKIDIVLLDIEMPGVKGFEVAEKLYARNKDIIIVFVTSHNEYSTIGYRYRAFRYILKSEPDMFIKRDINEAIEEYENNHVYWVFKYKELIKKELLSNIIYVEANRHYYIGYATNSNVYWGTGKFSTLAEDLKQYNFVRVHKGFIVNLKYVDYLDKKKGVQLTTNDSLPLGNKFFNKAVNKFIEYEGRKG